MRKLVDVFISDRLRATYHVVLDEPANPSDQDFIAYVKSRLLQSFTADEIATAKFVVRQA
ncbi:hypothetical protein [Reyranella sp.]|uniref:hypothetical protein n=1 Tax=Reyranella sp. TaxID=1929291 RepID=UPI003D0C17C2